MKKQIIIGTMAVFALWTLLDMLIHGAFFGLVIGVGIGFGT
jgi:hypothetical protein